MKQTKKTRPSKTGTPVMIRMQDDPLAAVDNWRREQPDLPSRSEAIRRLVEQGLKARQSDSGGKKR